MDTSKIQGMIEEVKASLANLENALANPQSEETAEAPTDELPIEKPEAASEEMESEAGEVDENGKPVVAVEEKKVMFGKKKPGGDFRKALGL